MKRILVIQLLRMGDVLQTTPAIAGLREQHPDSYIAVLARKVFAQPLLNNHAIDEVITWDVDALLTELFDHSAPLVENYHRVQMFIDDLRTRQFDTVINLTNDFLSALIAYLLPAKEVIGLTYRPDGSLKINGHWLKYLFLVPGNKRYNRYHLVDILANACGVKKTERALSFPILPEEEKFAHNFLQQARWVKDRLLIGLQPGASRAFKKWPAERFAELADKLGNQHQAQIILFGSANEINLGNHILSLMKEPAINAVGTTLGQLAALLKHCRLLITNNTGPMNIAAAVGTPTLVLSLGPEWCYQTGPYGNGHFVLEPELDCFPCSSPEQCDSLACRDLLTVDSVLRACELALTFRSDSAINAQADNGNASGQAMSRPSKCQAEELAGLSLYRSVIDPQLKRLTFIPLNRPRRAKADEILKEIYARFWERLCDNDRIPPGIPDIVGRMVDLSYPTMDWSLSDDAEKNLIRKKFEEYLREFQ
ncbi:MAG: glycosyltransferase family 9 protein, partial [candidate division KSB1 bacterium]|nr:glycosyltransferase family 9 protein [candidate division KSB1 bacterium]